MLLDKEKYYLVSFFPKRFSIRKQIQGFQNFKGGIFLCIYSISLQLQPQIGDKKNLKHYILILATVSNGIGLMLHSFLLLRLTLF